jgi:hypothetical protein
MASRGPDSHGHKTQAALSQIGREEKAAAADEVSPIVRHRVSMAQMKVMGFTEPVIGPARGPHRARAMGLPRFGPDPLAQPILRAVEQVASHDRCDRRWAVCPILTVLALQALVVSCNRKAARGNRPYRQS